MKNSVGMQILAAILGFSSVASGQSVVFRGLTVNPQGQAQVAITGVFPNEQLTVSNIGSSGNDGIEVVLPANTAKFRTLIQSVNIGSLPTGAFVQYVDIGTIDGGFPVTFLTHTEEKIANPPPGFLVQSTYAFNPSLTNSAGATAVASCAGNIVSTEPVGDSFVSYATDCENCECSCYCGGPAGANYNTNSNRGSACTLLRTPGGVDVNAETFSTSGVSNVPHAITRTTTKILARDIPQLVFEDMAASPTSGIPALGLGARLLLAALVLAIGSLVLVKNKKWLQRSPAIA